MNITYRRAALTKALLVVAILGMWAVAKSQQFAAQEPKSRSFKYTLTGEDWLVVHRANDAKDNDLWHPSYVTVTSTYRPVVAKHGDTWVITFRSPNIQTNNLP